MSILDSLGGYFALHTAKATLELQGATKTIIPNDVNAIERSSGNY